MSYRAFVLALILSMVAGKVVAKPPYVLGGVTYISAEMALATHQEWWDQWFAEVTRGQYYGGSLLVVLPPDSALMSKQFIMAYEPDFDEDSKDVYRKWYRGAAANLVRSLNKAALFDSVTLTRVVGYRRYAADYGYRFVLVYVGQPDGLKLADTVAGTEVVVKPAGEGMAGAINGIEQAIDELSTRPGGRSNEPASGATARIGPAPAVEAMHYDEQSRRGWVSVAGRGLTARDAIVRRIAEICATKNKLLVSDDLAEARGAFKILDEELKDGVLKLTFEALY